MSMTADILRGHTDAILLARLHGQDSYGYEISKSILERTGGSFEIKEATLYTAFRRLEAAGLIRSYWGDGDTGARRRYYSMTEAGRDAYAKGQAEWEAAKQTLDKLILA